MKRNSKGNERGIAMMIALFSLLLLSVVGLGMMYSTNMETSINTNYRDKQVAYYAALAGLQEARERIQPSTGDIPAPTALPSTSFQNIIYILSNSNVHPWDNSATNKYFDAELCQEKVLSLSGSLGVPCTTIAAGSTWYKTYDDSVGAMNPWNLTNPLDLKWVRISLKGNNMTPVAVNGNSANADQACWNGANQMSTPTAYTTGCKAQGGVTSIFVSTSGGGYSSTAPTIKIGGDGTGATATAVMAPETTGYVASIAVTSGGAGYTIAPTATINGDGTGAAATAVLSSTGTTTTTPGAVVSVTLTTGGSGYTSAPAVSLTGGGGVGAAAVAALSSTGTTVTTGYVSSVSVTAGGSGYTSAPTVGFSGGGAGAGGAAATAVLGTSGKIVAVNVSNAGTQCYSQASDVVVSFSGSSGSGAVATGVLETTRSCIYSVSTTASPNCNNKLTTANGYSPADQKSSVTFNDVGNKSAYGTFYVKTSDDKSPNSFTVDYPGYDSVGYSGTTFSSTLTIYVNPSTTTAWPIHSSQQDCNNISVTATTGYRLASVTVSNGGSGYTAATTVSITGGTGNSTGGSTNPTATATVGYPVTAVTVTAGGSNYTAAPTVTFTGGGGGCGVCTNAAATASVVTTSTTTYPVAYVTVTAGGSGYTGAPSVGFSGGSGSNAAATANVSASTTTTYPVDHVNVTAGGTGYTSALTTVSFSGGGGSNAAATATIGQQLTGTYSLSAITVDTPGANYSYDPPITICGTDTAGMSGCPMGSGPGSGATAVSQISGGTKFGQVYLVTSLAQTRTGARSMLQAEIATPVMGWGFGGALTLDGPNPVIDAMPNSNNFYIKGTDANNCHETKDADHPAIDGFDDPNASPPTNSVETIKSSLPRPDHYLGSGGTPSVQNGFASLGETMSTPTGLNSLIAAIYNAPGANHYGSNPGSIALGSCPTGNTNDASCHPIIDYVDGDLTLHGNSTGYGVLVVTGTLTMSGNFTWYGLVLTIGDGVMDLGGGGNGEIVGMMVDAKIWDNHTDKNLLSSLGSPTFHWNGGGGNHIYFDHCWSTNLMNSVPWTPPPTTKPLKVLSFRILPY